MCMFRQETSRAQQDITPATNKSTHAILLRIYVTLFVDAVLLSSGLFSHRGTHMLKSIWLLRLMVLTFGSLYRTYPKVIRHSFKRILRQQPPV